MKMMENKKIATKILNKTARSVVIELLGEARYETESYQLSINGEPAGRDNKMVKLLHRLKPATRYRVSFHWENGDWAEAEFETEAEFVTLNVKRFGAKGDGIADDTGAIQAAILCCPAASRVLIPAGTYKIRNLFLKSNLVLELGKGARLTAFQERSEYPILPGIIESNDGTKDYNLGSWEGNPLDMMAGIITGIQVEHVVICGEGAIDGGGDFEKWWVKGKNTRPPFRPRMIFLNRCQDIVLQGITVMNSPAWNIHPYFCRDIKIYGLKIESPDSSHNTDGIDPESCERVEIAGVHFSVGDDCIALKSGKIYMGRKFKQPSAHIRIRQCLMEKGHGAVTVGSEIAGGVQDVLVQKCVFRDTDRGLRIKTRRGRGKDSVLAGIVFEDISMDEVKAPFVVNSFYFCDPDGRTEYVGTQAALPADERTPEIKSLKFSRIDCTNAHYTGICIYGLPEKKVGEVYLEDIRISYRADVKAGAAAMMTECRPTAGQGIYAQNVEKIVLKNVRLEGAAKEFEFVGVDEVIF